MTRSTRTEIAESTLIQRAAQGDPEAFGRLYDQHVLKVFRHIYYLVGNQHLAEDLTAQAFLKAAEEIRRYEAEDIFFLAWLLRIANGQTNDVRMRQRHSDSPEQSRDTVEAQVATFSPKESRTTKDDRNRILERVRRLRGEQQQVIVMRFLDGLSEPGIARVLGKSVSAVRTTQYRALSALHRMLKVDLHQT